MSEWIRKDDVLKLIYDLSDVTTADVVEVVRCKDCKHRIDRECQVFDMLMNDDDFCSQGERYDN